MLWVTLTEKDSPAAATLNSFLSTEKMTLAELWVTLTVALAFPSAVLMVTVAERCVMAVFSSAETTTCALPEPLAALIFAQGALDVAVHAVLDAMENVLLSDFAVNASSAGETESVALAPVCLTVTGTHSLLSLQNTMTPSRASVEVFASAVNV